MDKDRAKQMFGTLRSKERKCARLGYDSNGDDSHLEFYGELSSSTFIYLSFSRVHVCISYTPEDVLNLFGL